jgi:hypothetical protein
MCATHARKGKTGAPKARQDARSLPFQGFLHGFLVFFIRLGTFVESAVDDYRRRAPDVEVMDPVKVFLQFPELNHLVHGSAEFHHVKAQLPCQAVQYRPVQFGSVNE